MKTIAAVLLSLTLCFPAFTQDATLRDVRSDCGALARSMAFRDQATKNPTWLDDLGRANFVAGYIQGFADAMPAIDHSKTEQSVDRVCKCIETHPDLWNLRRDADVTLVLHTLYGDAK